MSTPQDHLDWIAKQTEQAKTERYWERHAATTFTVLVVCALLSTIVLPIHWGTALAFVVAGVVIYAGALLDKKGNQIMGGSIMLLGLGLTIYVGVALGLRGSALWIQGIGLTMVGITGSRVFQQAVKPRPEEP